MKTEFNQRFAAVNVQPNCKRLVIDFDSKTVTQEFEAEFVPKDGDFVATKNGSIFVYKTEGRPASFKNMQAIPYFGLINGKELDFREYPITEAPNVIRYATESERKQLLDALAKEGKTWNPDLKRIELIRWRAKDMETYYYILTNNGKAETASSIEKFHPSDNLRYNSGNYYKFMEGNMAADRINAIFTENL